MNQVKNMIVEGTCFDLVEFWVDLDYDAMSDAWGFCHQRDLQSQLSPSVSWVA
jgi:hypothetical protein